MSGDLFFLFGKNLFALLSDIAPYFLFGLLVAGFLKTFLPQEKLARHLGESRLGAIFKAALLGIPLPLCSCGVLPVAVSLHRHGAGIPAVLAFLVATPQTSADALFVTYGLFGGAFTLAYGLAALAAGLLAGILGYLLLPHLPNMAPNQATGVCCAERSSPWKGVFEYAFFELPKELARPLVLGLLLAALLTTLLPPGFLGEKVPPGFKQYLVMLLAGVPVYMCSTGSLPLAYSFYLQGFSPGSLLVFLMSGPATNVTSLVVVKKIFGPRAFLIYAGSLIGGALLAGSLLDLMIARLRIPLLAPALPEETLPLYKVVAALVLGGLLLYHLLTPLFKTEGG
ncbi:MAG: permease [Thermodesulfobacteria bacterium]|nr:permease [Thermodesulfobacteriota bacterium]